MRKISFLRDGQRRAPGQIRALDLALVHAPGSAKAPSVTDSMSALGIYNLDRAGRQLPDGLLKWGGAAQTEMSVQSTAFERRSRDRLAIKGLDLGRVELAAVLFIWSTVHTGF